MINKRNLRIGMASTMLLLAACNSEMNAEDVKKSAVEVEIAADQLIQINKQLAAAEEKMSAQFLEVLANDEELASISDETADVVQNVFERTDLINNLDDYQKIVQEQGEYFGTYDGTDLPADTIKQISDSFLTFSQQLTDFKDVYQKSLNLQADYLTQISSEDANYEEFTNGIEEINQNYKDLQIFLIEFDKELIALNEQLQLVQDLTADEEDSNTTSDLSLSAKADTEEDYETKFLVVSTNNLLEYPKEFPQKFVFDSGVNIEYPDNGVKGIYVTANSAGGERMSRLVDLLNSTELNSMVIDIKDDYGNITLDLNSDNELVNEMTNKLIDAEELMATLEENNIYPIARIVVFKDSHLAEAHPEWSFTQSNGAVWSNNRGESFVNPYMKEVWDYNIEVAVQAAKLGFKDIQFDYVRFPEGFETRADSLNYSTGHYATDGDNVINMEYRNRAVTEFVREAKERLMPYGVDLSVDIFGYAAVVRETPGIGQSFPGISKEVDVISSMIYPSHWGPGNLGIAKPDLEPYNVVNNYMDIELEIMEELGDEAPITRPWIQDFTASYLGAGNYKRYGASEVTAQVKALADNGVHEFLLWNAGNTYSQGATYSFE